MNISVLDRDHYVDQLQTIHALRDALELSPQDYRQLLERLTGSSSARYMTPGQRDHVITFLKVHKALDDAIALAEEARSVLNESYIQSSEGHMPKTILLDGKVEATMSASLEDVIATMRTLHGHEVKLTGIEEKRSGSGTRLELSFERPAVFLLAS
ncbi:MAG: hypothetical protein KC422_20065 [Trueperaceae bacterium]|nr:hypothetical protein [Trueperaceae bacterium]